MKSQPLLIGLLLSTSLCVGCTQRETSLPGVTFDRDDPIQTFAQYKKALKDAKSALPDSLKTTLGTEHTIAGIRELARLPSAPSRAYTQGLIDALRKGGLTVSDLPSTVVPAPRTMTYAELAQLEALSISLVDSQDAEGPPVAPERKLPRAARINMLLTIAALSPGDISAMSASTAPFRPLPRDQQGGAPNADPIERRARNHQMFVDTFSRYLNSNRPLNLSSLQLFSESTGTALAMLFYYYAYTIDDPTGHDLQDLARGLKSSAGRARSIDRSRETQKMLDTFIADLNDKKTFVENFDFNIHIAPQARPTIERFFAAMHAHDQTGLHTVLDPRLWPWSGVISAKLADTEVPDFTFEVRGAADGPRGSLIIDYHTTKDEAKHEPGGTSAIVKRQGDHWIIMEIANVKGEDRPMALPQRSY